MALDQRRQLEVTRCAQRAARVHEALRRPAQEVGILATRSMKHEAACILELALRGDAEERVAQRREVMPLALA